MRTQEPTTYPFGASVNFTQTFRRRRTLSRSGTLKEWQATQPQPPKNGLLIGYRTLANGLASYEGEDEGTVFYPTEHVRAALVAVDLKHKPVLVPLTDLVLANE